MRHLTYRGVVYPWQCDHMGHMNVAHYVGKFDEATWHVFRLCGITSAYLRDNAVAMAGVRQEINYRRELRPGDTIRIESHVVELGRRKIDFVHEMYDDATDDLVAECALTAVHIDSGTRKATDFPQAVGLPK
jgi:acyl-CoA thioester hydrolase